MSRRRRYRLRNAFADFFMVCVTGGLWLIYILFRELRTREK